MPERSMRRIDPLAALASFPLTVLAACAAPLTAVLLMLQHIDDIDYPLVMVAALILLTIASAGMVLRVAAANAVRSQFSTAAHAVIVGLAIVAAALAAVAQWRSNEMLRDDWGPLAVGILLLGIAPYRSIRSLIIAAGASAMAIGSLAAVQAQTMQAEVMDTAVPTMAYVVLAVVPVLALAAGGVAYAMAAVQSRERWQRLTEEVARANASTLRDPIARSVQHERVAVLNREVVPFFSAVLQEDRVTRSDTERAQGIASTVRGIMVEEANRSWLRSAVDEISARAGVEAGDVHDPRNLTARMTFGQRAAVRALLDALFTHPGFQPAGFSAIAASSGSHYSVRITAVVHGKPRALRRVAAPYLAVIRAVFCVLEVTMRSPNLTLRFSYEH
jgi:hypothetical protein